MDPDDRSAARVSPEAVARKSFGTSFRGYDQLEVRAFLNDVAEELRDARDREADLRSRLLTTEQRLAQADELDEGRLTEILGNETAKVIMAAKEAAVAIRAKAEDSVAGMLREAQDEITRHRAQADADVQQRLGAAERAAEEIRAGAMVVRAEAAAAAEAEVETARGQGRNMVAEAQAVRERVLQDLSRRRKAARQQIEQLNAGRERLLEAYEVVQRTLDQATRELRVALPEARMAAETAARRIDDEPEMSIDDIEAEVAAARIEGGAVEEPAEVELTEVESGDRAAVEDEPEPEDDPESEVERGPDDEPSPEAESATTEIEPAGDELGEVDPSVASDEPPSDEPRIVTPPRWRRRRRGADLPEAEFVALTAPDPMEGVRVVAPPKPAEEEQPAAEPEPPAAEVDDLFARLRADREAAVEGAGAGLAGEEPSETDEGDDDSDVAVDIVVLQELVEIEVVADAEAGERETLLERRDAAAEEVEHRLARHLKRVLSDEQNEVLDLLRRRDFATVADLLPAKRTERYADAARADLEAAAAAGAGFFARSNGDAAEVAVDVADLAGDLAGTIVSVVHERVERAFAESAGEPDELTERVRACYREWKTQRISDTARHYVLAAFTRGVFEAQPAGATLCWLVDDGGSPCPDAEDNALAGEVVKGDPFPTGHAYPPAHPGCRCLVVPTHR